MCRCDEHSESDYVEFSNYMAHDNTYGRYCGNLSAFYIESRRNFFRISFRSNHVLDGTGFRAIYQFVNNSSNREMITNTNLAHVKSKSRNGELLHSRLEFILASPNYYFIASRIISSFGVSSKKIFNKAILC